MANISYLIRLDDACPTMDSVKWKRIESILDSYSIHPMVGIIPDNNDPKLKIDPEDSLFWAKALNWQTKGWTIALHGYDHVYHKSNGGLNPLWNKSEFVGLSYDDQYTKLENGKKMLNSYGLSVEYFFAPSHTFDQNTIRALSAIGINKISDTIAFEPYKNGDTIFIPQLGGRCRKMNIPGIYTFCFHPNIMEEKDFLLLEKFISEYRDSFVSFNDINLNKIGQLSIASRILRNIYFLRRKFQRVIAK